MTSYDDQYLWLKDLSQGDRVIIRQTGWSGGYTIAKIKRLTKTQIILDNNCKFRKSDGYQIGGSTYHSKRLIEPTIEKIAEIKESEKREKLIYDIGRMNWNKIKTENLEKVFELTEKVTNK